jgi:hypothetical protein
MKKNLFEITFGDGPPKVMGQMAGQQFVDQINRPENIVDDQQYPAMIVMPADHQRIEAEQGVDNSGRSSVHGC